MAAAVCCVLDSAQGFCSRLYSEAFFPTSGAKALCCSAHAEVMDMMCSAPRWAVHQALAEKTPATYAARHAPTLELGLSPDMEDPAIAYRLLMEVTAPISVSATASCHAVAVASDCHTVAL